jgi:WS/DGAT/MGAT family acyltransferase
VPIGPHRRYAVARQRLADYKEIKNALGGTVNDVVLTVVSGALASWLRGRGVDTAGLEMRALVPVSVRTQDQRGSLGNQLAVMRGPLPVFIDDPVERLQFVREAMDGLKESKQAVGASTLAAVNNLAPPTVLAQASRLNFSTRLFNLIVTNVPGPQLPLYVLGRELVDLFPVAFLPEDHALAIAIMSYNGALDYGLLGDYDALADIDVVVQGLEDSLAALLEAARGGDTPKPRRTRAKRTTNGGGDVASIMSSAATRPKQGPAADMRAKRARARRTTSETPEA